MKSHILLPTLLQLQVSDFKTGAPISWTKAKLARPFCKAKWNDSANMKNTPSKIIKGMQRTPAVSVLDTLYKLAPMNKKDFEKKVYLLYHGDPKNASSAPYVESEIRRRHHSEPSQREGTPKRHQSLSPFQSAQRFPSRNEASLRICEVSLPWVWRDGWGLEGFLFF